MRGANLRETIRFSKICNGVAEQIHPIPKGRKNGYYLLRQTARPGN